MITRSFLLFLMTLCLACSKNTDANSLLKKSIAYHDPNNRWPSFKDGFHVSMTTPNSVNRESDIVIDIPSQIFSLSATRDSITTEYRLNKNECTVLFNGKPLDSLTSKPEGIDCERGLMYKNYYTYLYGLPMKLNDVGTQISDDVEERFFKGKAYKVLKVTYDKAVGSDIWYFYFDPKTFAMEIYQFFKTNDEGEIIPNSGEYILLSEIEDISGIKMPKIRAWYYNKDDSYLGTDTLYKN